jgi:hypothetical protein
MSTFKSLANLFPRAHKGWPRGRLPPFHPFLSCFVFHSPHPIVKSPSPQMRVSPTTKRSSRRFAYRSIVQCSTMIRPTPPFARATKNPHFDP